MPGSSRRLLQGAAVLAALAICLLSPALASARITVPPGATEGDQYFEEVPNGAGGSSVDRHGGGAGGSGGGPAVAATQALNAMGPEGQAAADLANSNRPPVAGQGSGGDNAQPSSSTAGEGGMGALFPILLVAAALAAVAYGLRRRLNPT
jgi:hypothetical protein